MARRYINVLIKGKVGKTYYVGCTVAEQVSGDGCAIWIPGGKYVDLPPRQVFIGDSNGEWVGFVLDDDSVFTVNDLKAIVKVWDSYPSPSARCLAGKYTTFRRARPIVPQPVIIDDFIATGGWCYSSDWGNVKCIDLEVRYRIVGETWSNQVVVEFYYNGNKVYSYTKPVPQRLDYEWRDSVSYTAWPFNWNGPSDVAEVYIKRPDGTVLASAKKNVTILG